MGDDINPVGEDIPPGSQPEQSGEERRRRKHRRKIKVRKRVRIKKKTSSRKKARKMMETVAWVLIVAAFIITIVMIVLQLDLDSKHRQKKRDTVINYSIFQKTEDLYI